MARTTKKTVKKAKPALKDVTPEQAFWCCDGLIFHNLSDLAKGLGKMSKETYAYHANAEKSDFANWVQEALGEKALAIALRKAATKTVAKTAVEKKIK